MAALAMHLSVVEGKLVTELSSKVSMILGIVNLGEWEADIVDGVSLRLFLCLVL